MADSAATGSDPLVTELRAHCAGEVDERPSLAAHTTLRVGGTARARVMVERDTDLDAVADVCADHDVGWLIIGRGSNLLVADEGWPGVAVTLGRGYRGVEITDGEGAGARVRAGAAVPLPSLAARVAEAGLTGFAWGAAVPGSLGGAVRMNAGAHGSELAEHLVAAELYRLHARRRETWPRARLGLRYRHSELPDDAVVVGATLELVAGDADEVRREIREIRRWRREHQPLNEPNCGSVFTNPPGDSAGRLVEAVGGKQLTVGGASVSQRHANFVVTRNGTRAADVRALIDELQRRVRDELGVTLDPEVVMIGDFTT